MSASLSNPLATVGYYAYRLAFEISPILLSGGLASGIAGGLLPIVALTEGIGLISGLLNDGSLPTLDQFFAHFRPAPGASLEEFQLGRYPFANQTVAANAIIAQPLHVGLQMTTTISRSGAYTAKFLTFMALKAAIDQHCQQGGTFTVMTPTYIYQNCLLLSLRDVSGGESSVPQHTWQWDFEQPLVTLQQAAGAQSALMSKLTAGVPTDGSLSGASAVPGAQLSGAAPITAPAIAGSPGAVGGGYGATSFAPGSVP